MSETSPPYEGETPAEPLHINRFPADLRRALDRLVFDKKQAGQRTTLRAEVIAAIQAHIDRHKEAS